MEKRILITFSGYLVLILAAHSVAVADNAIKSDFKDIREGYVEAQTVMVSSKAGQQAQQELKARQEESLKKVQQSEQEFVKAQKEFANKATTLSAEAQAKEQKKLAQMERKGQEMMQEIKEELQMEMYKKTEVLDQELMLAAAEYAKQNNLDVVKDKTTGRPLYVAQRLDCTEGLTKVLDKQFEDKNKNKKNIKVTAVQA